MGIFAEAMKEVKFSLLKVFMFEETLNTILVFLVAYLISSLFRLWLLVPLLAGIGYLCFAVYSKTHIRTDKTVETKYKELQEKLSTAAEYAAVDNRVVNELKSEVLRNLRKVEESTFLDERKVYAKSVAAIVLCFIILLTSPVSAGFFKASFPDLFSGSDDNGNLNAKFRVGKEKAQGELPVPIQGTKSEIYGAPTVAKLGSEEIEVILKPAGTELGTRNVKLPEEIQFTEQYPEEAPVPVAAESMEERIPKEQQELVRRYFKNIVEAGS